MASLLAPLLKGVLSKFFSNFDEDKLTLGWLGNVTLEDLHLKTDVLDQFNLPFKVIGGRVGKFYLNLGLGGIATILMGSTTVVELTLTDVDILAVPPSALPYDKEKADAAALATKRKDLQSMIEERNSAAENVGKKESSPSFVQNAILGVINNVKITVKNIHIRYEDANTKPDTPFACGFVLKSLTGETCDKDWKPATLGFDATFFKLVDLTAFGVYWNSNEKNMISSGKDTSDDSLTAIVDAMKSLVTDENSGQLKYIIGPLGTQIKAMVTLKPENLPQPFSLPKADIKIEMKELKAEISNEQFGEALILAESLEKLQRGIPYQKYRPFNTPYKGHAKEWWKFAYNCILDKVRQHGWKFLIKHELLINPYEKAYTTVAKAGDDATDEDKKAAQDLEDQLDNQSIMDVRDKVDLQVSRQKKLDKLIAAKSGYFSTYVPTQEDIDNIFTKDMSPEEKAKFSTYIEEESKPVKYPTDDDYTEFKVHADLDVTSVNIVNTSKDSPKIQNVLKLTIDKFNVSGETHPAKNGLRVDAGMSKIGITGLEEEGHALPQLLSSVTDGTATDFLTFAFEKNPFDSKVATRVKFASEKLDVIYHVKTIQKLIDTFTWPEQVELRAARAAVSSSIDKAKENSLEGIKNLAKDTEEMDVDIKVTAPRILVPQNGELTDTSSVLIVNLGVFTLKSIPPDSGGKGADISKITEVGKTEADVSPEILRLTYNEYDVNLADFEILIALPGEDLGLPSESDKTMKKGTPTPLLKKGEIIVKLNQCKISDDVRFPELKIDVQIALLDLELVEDRMLHLMELALTLPLPASRKANVADVQETPNQKLPDAAVTQSDAKPKDSSIGDAKTDKTDTDTKVEIINPELAIQLTKLLCTVHVQGLKLSISQQDKASKTVPVLDFVLAEINATIRSQTYGNSIVASLGEIVATYSGAKIIGYDGPIHLIDTPNISEDKTSKTPFLSVHLFFASDECPKHIPPGFPKQHIYAHIASLELILHQEALVSILSFANRISKEMAKIQEERSVNTPIITSEPNKEKEKEKEKEKPGTVEVIGAAPPIVTNTGVEHPEDIAMKITAGLISFSIQFACEAKRIGKIEMKQLDVSFEDGSIKSTILVTLDAIDIINMDTSAKYKKILGVTGKDKLLDVKVLSYKNLTTRGDTDPDMEIAFNLGSPRLILCGSFFGNILNFVNKFQTAKKAIADVSKKASEKALDAVKDSYSSNETKISLQLKIAAPEIFLPRSTSNEAVILVLGEFQVNNKLEAVPSNDSARKAIIDNITISYTGIRISRAILQDNSDIIAESVFLEPISIKMDIVRNLSSAWYGALPQFKIIIDLNEALVRICAGDMVFIFFCLLDFVTGLLGGIKEPPKKEIVLTSGIQGPITPIKKETKELAPVNAETPKPAKSWLLSLQGSIKKIGGVIYKEPTNLENKTGQIPRDEKIIVGEIALQNCTVGVDLWNNSDLKLNFAIKDIITQDSRQSNSGGIKDCVKRKVTTTDVNNENPMIGVQFSLNNQNNGDKAIDAEITTSSIEIILNFEFLKALLDIIKETQGSLTELINRVTALVSEGPPQNEKSVTSESPQSDESKSALLINGKIRLNEITVVVLEDASSTNSNAIELSIAGTFDLKSDNGGNGNGEIKIGLTTTKYRTNSDIKLAEVIRPNVIQIKVSLSPIIDIGVEVPDIALQLSAGTLLLVANIAGAAGKAFASNEVENTIEKDFSKVWEVKENSNEDYWFLKPELTKEAAPAAVPVAGPLELKNGGVHIVKEKLSLIFRSLSISLQVGSGSMTTPLFAADGVLSTEVSNWSSDLLATGSVSITMAYNNTNNGTWEDLLEPNEIIQPFGPSRYKPFEFKYEILKPASSTTITVNGHSDEIMELTLTKTGIIALKKLIENFTGAINKTISKSDVKSAPYTLTNDSGYPLTLNINEASPFIYLKNDEPIYGDISVAPGEQIDLGLSLHIASSSSKAKADRILTISIPELQFSETVNVGIIKSRFFPLHKQSSRGEQYGLLIGISSKNFCIRITARGIVQLKNEIEIPVDIFISSKVQIGTVQPSGLFNLPLQNVYEDQAGIYLRPKGYGLCQTPLRWVSSTTVMTSANESGHGDNAHLKVIGKPKPSLLGNTNTPCPTRPNYTLTIKSQVIINNLLPLPLTFATDGGTHIDIESGRSIKTICLTPAGYRKNEYSFILQLANFRGLAWTSRIQLQESNEMLTPLVFTSHDGEQTICFGYMTDGKEKKVSPDAPTTIYIYCPYWMVNYTGLDLYYNSADSQNFISHQAGVQGPVLFAGERTLGCDTSIRCEGSEWSQQIAINNNTGVPTVISLQGKDQQYQLGLSCQLSEVSLTRIVTLTARYNIVNSSPYTLILIETDVETKTTTIQPHHEIPFWPTGTAMRFSVSVQGTEGSTPDISYNENSDNMLRLPNKYGGIRTTVTQTPTKTTITLSEFNSMEVPLLIVNDTKDVTINFHQEGETPESQLGPGQSVIYAWNNFNTRKIFEWTPQNLNVGYLIINTVNFDKNTNGDFESKANEEMKAYKWVTFAKYLRRTLLITGNSSLADKLTEASTQSTEQANVDVKISFDGFGLSLVDNTLGKEILYVRIGSMGTNGNLTAQSSVLPNQVVIQTIQITGSAGSVQQFSQQSYRPGAQIIFKMFPESLHVDMQINQIDIDNQLLGAQFPILFYLTPKILMENEVRPPIFSMNLSKKNPPNSSLNIISCEMVMQKFDIKADMGLVEAMLDFISLEDDEGKSKQQFNRYTSSYTSASEKEADYYAEQYENSASDKAIYIFENINLHNLQFRLSFSLTGGEPGTFTSAVLGVGAALVDLKNSELNIEGLQLHHVRLTIPEFMDQVIEHFTSNIITNVMHVAFNLSVLSPLKVVGGITSGLSHVLTDPLKGLMTGNIVDGISGGVKGVGTIVTSATDSLSDLTGLLGNTLGSLGLGIIGTPLNLVSDALAAPGIAASGRAPEVPIERVRPPRILEPDAPLEPYSLVVAEGESFLRMLDPKAGQYIFHVNTSTPFIFLLAANMAFYATLQQDMKTLQNKIWSVSLVSLDNVRTEGNRMIFHKKQVKHGWLDYGEEEPLEPVLFADMAMAQWVLAQVQVAIPNLNVQQIPQQQQSQGQPIVIGMQVTTTTTTQTQHVVRPPPQQYQYEQPGVHVLQFTQTTQRQSRPQHHPSHKPEGLFDDLF